MNADWIRERCLSFPHATELLTWGIDLTFRVAGKIFAITVLEPAQVWLSFKCSAEDFAELTERSNIIPAPYLARAQWVALETKGAIAPEELEGFLRKSYDLVFAKLPKKTRASLALAKTTPGKAGRKSSARKAKSKSRKK